MKWHEKCLGCGGNITMIVMISRWFGYAKMDYIIETVFATHCIDIILSTLTAVLKDGQIQLCSMKLSWNFANEHLFLRGVRG